MKDLDVDKVALDDDKQPDCVVVCTSSLYCDSGGCSAWVLMSNGNRHRSVAPDILDLTVADTRTKGVPVRRLKLP